MWQVLYTIIVCKSRISAYVVVVPVSIIRGQLNLRAESESSTEE